MLQKVMVVNDNELLLMIAEKMIGICGFAKDTVTATDGQIALEHFDELLNNAETKDLEAPEFIFLDLHMPSMDGWEFLEIFVQQYSMHFPNIRIAILSASADMTDMLLLVKYPIVIDFISTAIDDQVLARLASKLLQPV
jgi:CheY-like chemotaxis protein